MRIVMLGTGGFAVPTFRRLLESEHEVPLLVTRPARPGQGRKNVPPSPMMAEAQSRGLPVLAPESINTDEARAAIAAYAPDLLVVCDYGQILKPATLAIAKLGGINLHGSLLPRYRGAAPVNWAIYHGDAESGITVIHMTPLLDGGPMIAVARTPIDPNETAVELERRLSELGVEPVMQAIRLLGSNTPTENGLLGAIQPTGQVTKAPRLRKEDAMIDWRRTAQQIHDQIRAFKPWPGTFTTWKRQDDAEPLRLIVDAGHIFADDSFTDYSSTAKQPGEIITGNSKSILVATGDGVVQITHLQPAGKRVLTAEEFLRGYPLKAGDLLGVS